MNKQETNHNFKTVRQWYSAVGSSNVLIIIRRLKFLTTTFRNVVLRRSEESQSGGSVCKRSL
jgi:hypothetical protein